MKKALSLILALVLCLGLCACGGNSKYAKYDALIGYIESDNYIGAITELNKFIQPKNYIGVIVDPTGTEQTDPPAEDVRVEITLENWQEYFEITMKDSWRKNAFGDVTSFSHALVFRLKESYADRVVSESEGNVIDVEIGYNYKHYDWTVDFENRTYTKGGRYSGFGLSQSGYATKIIRYWPWNAPRGTDITSNSRSKDGTGSLVITEYDGIEVLRIQGTLVLKGE